MKPKPPSIPAERADTIRRLLLELLTGPPQGIRDLSVALGLAEREVVPHLEHLRRTLHGSDRTLVVSPAVCRKCGFIFVKRQRLSRPGKCPVCRGQSIAPPRFAVR